MTTLAWQLCAILFVLSPGLLGGAIGWALGSKHFARYAGVKFMLLGTGGILGFIGIAGVLWSINYVGRNPFNICTPTILLILACTVTATARSVEDGFSSPASIQLNTILKLAPMCTLLVLAFIQHQHIPTTAWDALDLWSPQAARFIDFNFSKTEEASAQFDYSHSYHHRHPFTIAALASWSGWISSYFGSSIGAHIPWLFCMICICSIVGGYTYDVSSSVSFACLIAYCAASLPLLENHNLLAGYAELWMTGLVAASVTLGASSTIHNGRFLFIAGIATAMLLIPTKNTGPAFFMAFVLAGFSFVLLKQSSRGALAALFSVASIALIIILTGFSFSLFGREFSLIWGEPSYLQIPGLKMPITFNPLFEVAANELHSLIINQSFSILLLAAMITFIISLKRARSNARRNAIIYIFLVATSLLLMLTASQVVTDYAFRHATPAQDTGNSRFSLPFSICLLIACSHIWSRPLSNSYGSS